MQRATHTTDATELITPAAYARLRNLSKSTISRQVRDGKIPTIGGLIDPAKADRARDRNLQPMKRRKTGPRNAPAAAATPEFNRGASWLATELCTSTRTAWPTFVATLAMPAIAEEHRTATRALIAGLMVHLIQEWAVGFVDIAALPGIDWAAFGGDAAATEREFRTVMAELS